MRIKPGCGRCGGPLFSGKCIGWCANNKVQKNKIIRQERKSIELPIAKQNSIAIRILAELMWKPEFKSSHGADTSCAIWRAYRRIESGYEILVYG